MAADRIQINVLLPKDLKAGLDAIAKIDAAAADLAKPDLTRTVRRLIREEMARHGLGGDPKRATKGKP